MNDLALQAEHQKLARLLGCDESCVAAMSGLNVLEFRQLRAACTARLFDGDRTGLQRVVGAARLMPAGLNAIMAEKAMGPVLSSRVAGMLPPKDAVEIAKRVPLAFNSEVTLLIDPRSAVAMLKLMPTEIVVGVTREVARRREYIAMARFIDALSNDQIRACMDVLDDEAMLRIGFYVESPERLEEVVGLMSAERLQKIMAVAAKPELDLGGAVLMLLSGVSKSLRTRLAEAAMSHPDEAVGESLVAAASLNGMLDLLHPLTQGMNRVAAQRLKELLA